MFIKPYFWPEYTHNIKLNELKVLAKLDKLKIPLFILKVPCKPTKPTEPAVKYG